VREARIGGEPRLAHELAEECALVGEALPDLRQERRAPPFVQEDDAVLPGAQLREELGIGYCNITKCCTNVCPENITITDNAIIPLKERVVDQSYDPLSKLIRKVRGKE